MCEREREKNINIVIGFVLFFFHCLNPLKSKFYGVKPPKLFGAIHVIDYKFSMECFHVNYDDASLNFCVSMI